MKDEYLINDDAKNSNEALNEKLAQIETPGYQVEFDPEEAELAGAFFEEAISEEDANESVIDLPDALDFWFSNKKVVAVEERLCKMIRINSMQVSNAKKLEN